MKPMQIAVQLSWKGVYGRDQRINAVATHMSLFDEGARKTISVSFEGLPATVKGALETAKRADKDSMEIEIFVEDGHSRLTFLGNVLDIPMCHLVKEHDRIVIDFTLEEIRKNESHSLTEKKLAQVVNEAYGSDIEDMEEGAT